MNPIQSSGKSILPSMTDEQLHRIIGHFEQATLVPKEGVFCPEDTAQFIFIIDGEVVVCKNADGTEVEHTLTDGMSYGEHEILSNRRMGRYMVAKSKARV